MGNTIPDLARTFGLLGMKLPLICLSKLLILVKSIQIKIKKNTISILSSKSSSPHDNYPWNEIEYQLTLR